MSPPGSFKQYALNVLNKNICSLSILPERNKIKAEESLIANQPNDVYLKSFFFYVGFAPMSWSYRALHVLG